MELEFDKEIDALMRKGAAGINHLPESDYGRFVNLFYSVYGNQA